MTRRPSPPHRSPRSARPLVPGRSRASSGAALILVGLVGSVLPIPAGAQEVPPSAEPGEAAPTASRSEAALQEPAAAVKGARQRPGNVLQRIWWNQPEMVTSLGLREEQRDAMDRLLLANLEQRREQVRRQLKLRGRLAQEVAAARWSEAEETASELGAVLASLGAEEARLVVAVGQLLDPDQLQKLEAENPRLLRVPWVRGNPMTTRVRSRQAEPNR